MHARKATLAAAALVFALSAPMVAHAASCITTIAGNQCFAHCLGNLVPNAQQACGSNGECHQAFAAEISAALQALASVPAGTPLCAAAVENAAVACNCVLD